LLPPHTSAMIVPELAVTVMAVPLPAENVGHVPLTVGRSGGMVESVSLAPDELELLIAPELDECELPLDDPDELAELELDPPLLPLPELPLPLPLPSPELPLPLPPLLDSLDPLEVPLLVLVPCVPWPTLPLDPDPPQAGTTQKAPRSAKTPHGASQSDLERTGASFVRTCGVFASVARYATR
jgi:hypothetical protein